MNWKELSNGSVLNDMEKPSYIVIHHSATKDQKHNDWNAITRFHTSFRRGGDIISPKEASALRAAGEKNIINPWPYVGYNSGIEEVDGQIKFMTGHAIGKQGYHCKESRMNFRSIGICMVGNFDLEVPSFAKLKFLQDLCYSYMVNYGILASNIIGHRDAALMVGLDWEKGQFKTCPGKLFPLQTFKEYMIGVGGG